jgi:hypothetical protein
MKVIKGDLVLKEDTIINDDLKVEGNIRCDGGLFNLKCGNLNCWNLNCLDLTCRNLNCGNLNCGNLNCGNLNCLDLNFYAFAIAYYSFKCKSWESRRANFIIKCLDGEIEIKKEKKYCDKGGKEIKVVEVKE